MWPRLAEAWRRPGGYRPGAMLTRLSLDWPELDSLDAEDEGERRFRFPHGDWSFSARERVEAGWLAHVVACEFLLSVPGAPGRARIRLRHGGFWRRSGIVVDLLDGDAAALAPLLERLRADADLRVALSPLDFKRCELHGGQDGWQIHLEPYGASEVACRLPPLRRYIGLRGVQGLALLASLAACRRALLAEEAGRG
ncbi:DUF3156 family protein [Chromobacterium sp. IRSSSOUMB001]|uniref:DUF3156 family protein n=1 Tax=Chromobacterium sp. IRSSSOUMB001 TaxID=2927123 RepID=UPI0031F623D2